MCTQYVLLLVLLLQLTLPKLKLTGRFTLDVWKVCEINMLFHEFEIGKEQTLPNKPNMSDSQQGLLYVYFAKTVSQTYQSCFDMKLVRSILCIK